MNQMNNLAIDAHRLCTDLIETAPFGGTRRRHLPADPERGRSIRRATGTACNAKSWAARLNGRHRQHVRDVCVHPDNESLQALEAKIEEALEEVASANGVTETMSRIWECPPVSFAEDCIESIHQAARPCGYRAREIASGAGHDAAYISRVAPRVLIFIPCKDR